MKHVVSVAALLLLSGCSDTSAVKDAVKENLIDPGSVEFGEITIVDGAFGKLACATVNARNSFGGYTGEQQIMLKHMDEAGWMWAGESPSGSHEGCIRFITDMANDDGSEAAAAIDAIMAGEEPITPTDK
jgi:hypothetical protein